MKIETLELGYLDTNCYILKKDDVCLIIDPAYEVEKIVKNINTPLAILITHYHGDHIGALKDLKDRYDIPVYDFNTIGLKEVGPFTFEVIETTGHDDTCVSFYFKEEKKMFVGDFIFRKSIGRTDLETGDEGKMFSSIDKIKTYDDEIELFPGHGIVTTLGYEKENNPFF